MTSDAAAASAPKATLLLNPWAGPFGGLPPIDAATPEALEAATGIAVEAKRAEIAAILANPQPPTFENTALALENCGRALERVNAVRAVLASTKALGAMPDVQRRLTQMVVRLEDEIALSGDMLARIESITDLEALDAEDRRLVEVIVQRMRRRGAGLTADARAKIGELNAKLSELMVRFAQNIMREEAETFTVFDDAAALEGFSAAEFERAANEASARGLPGKWLVANRRGSVWPVLTKARRRETRRRVRDLWMSRCGGNKRDNRPVIAEILKLRGEIARLMGHPSFAHLACEPRMAAAPDAALAQLLRTWKATVAKTRDDLAELQALADADGIGPIEPWDRLYYAEQLRQKRFAFESASSEPYFELGNVMRALFEAAGKLHGLSFRDCESAPRVHPDVRVVEVMRAGETIGLVYFDVLERDGKMPGSWQSELRAHRRSEAGAAVLSVVVSSLRRNADGAVLLAWEYARVLFHEFGHAMHMLLANTRYRSLGSMAVAWDMIETPAQLNEHWLLDRALLRRHMRHYQSGEPIPEAMLDALQATLKRDRSVTLGLDYLFPAIVDLRVHLAANGDAVDPVAIEEALRAELAMPAAVDPIMRIFNLWHVFSGNEYAAGLYSYLWADVMVADIREGFVQAPDGLYDQDMAKRWREGFLSAGASAPGVELFRRVRGRDPDPDALLRLFDLAAAQ
jgi:peptidyl-dipeptidase Dcp